MFLSEFATSAPFLRAWWFSSSRVCFFRESPNGFGMAFFWAVPTSSKVPPVSLRRSLGPGPPLPLIASPSAGAYLVTPFTALLMYSRSVRLLLFSRSLYVPIVYRFPPSGGRSISPAHGPPSHAKIFCTSNATPSFSPDGRAEPRFFQFSDSPPLVESPSC